MQYSQAFTHNNRPMDVLPIHTKRRSLIGLSAGAALFTATGLSAHAFQTDRRGDPPRKPGVDLREAPAVLGPRRGAPAEPGAALVEQAWTVSLAAFRGEQAEATSAAALARIRAVPALKDAVAIRRGEAVIITVGSFPDPAGPEAQQRLREVRELVVEGQRAFGQAVLSPPEGGQVGSRPEFNLLRARDQFGKGVHVTLQVGIYGRDDLDRPSEKDLAEARQQAEAAAVQLRREGELAFYYHGPRRSTVTVGVFSEEDLGDAQKGVPRSPELDKLKRKFPYNLYNGAGIRERVPGLTEPRLQESQTVRIPER